MKPVAHALLLALIKALADGLVSMALGKDEACRTCRFSYALVIIINLHIYLSCHGQRSTEPVLKEAAVKEGGRKEGAGGPLSAQRASCQRGSPKRGTGFGERGSPKRGRAFQRSTAAQPLLNAAAGSGLDCGWQRSVAGSAMCLALHSLPCASHSTHPKKRLALHSPSHWTEAVLRKGHRRSTSKAIVKQ